MWSPALVPKPKDWPDHVDVVGMFNDSNGDDEGTQWSSPSPLFPLLNPHSLALSPVVDKPQHAAQSETADFVPSAELLSFLAVGPQPQETISTPLSDSVLSRSCTLSSPSQPHAGKVIFVGFGSMKLEDLAVGEGAGSGLTQANTKIENVVGLFLEAAAIMGLRIIVQSGWTSLTQQSFLELALQVTPYP